MPGAEGDIWVDSDGQFIVTETGEVIILIPELASSPVGVWTQDSPLIYEAWDADE